MKQIIYNLKDISAVNASGDIVTNANVRLYCSETLILLGDRDSGRSAFFDFLCGRAQKLSGEIYGKGGRKTDTVTEGGVSLLSDLNQIRYIEKGGMSIMEYIFLMRKKHPSFIWRPAGLRREAMELLKMVGLEKNPEADLSELSHFEMILTDLARAVYDKVQIVLVQEDFEGISAEEMMRIKEVTEFLKNKYHISFIINTNALRGVPELADRCAVFAGRTIMRIHRMSDPSVFRLIERELYPFYDRLLNQPGKTDRKEIYRIAGAVLGNNRMDTLSVRKGEAVSVVNYDMVEKAQLYAALTGSGNGTVWLDGEELPDRWNRDPVRYPVIGLYAFGIQSLFPQLSPEENIALPSYAKLSSGRVFLPHTILPAVRQEWKKSHGDVKNTVSEMPRGDRLALQLESWWVFHPKVLILFEPFLHLDRYGRDIVAEYFRRFRERDTAIIVLSGSRTNYLGEDAIALQDDLFDRVVLISSGKIMENEK